MRRIWILSLFTLGSLTALSNSGLFAGDAAAKLRCEPKPPPFECGTPTPNPCPDPAPTPPKPTPVVRDHRHPPVVRSGPIVRDHRHPVVTQTSGPTVRDHRTPVVATGPTIRDHRTPPKPKDPIVSGPYQVPAPVYTPRPVVDTSNAPGGVVVTNSPKPKSPRPPANPKPVVRPTGGGVSIPFPPIPVIKVDLPF